MGRPAGICLGWGHLLVGPSMAVIPHQGVVVSYTEQQHKRTACPRDGPNRELQSRPRTLQMLKESDGISPEPHTLSVTTKSLLCRSLHNVVTNVSSFCCQHTGGNALDTRL